MIRTYKCRGKLTRSGHDALSRVFGMCATLYNACLEERIDCYRKTGQSRMVGRMREKQDSGLARPRTVEVTV